MCGLFGFIGNALDPEVIVKAFESAKDRGPDGWSYFDGKERISFVDSKDLLKGLAGKKLVLGHCRLATSGSVAVQQPIIRGSNAIAHNGNVPCYAQACDRLGITLETGCDTELILRLLEQAETINCVIKSLSLSAYAIAALVDGSLYLTASRLPLFVLESSNGLYWCSKKLGDNWVAINSKKVTATGSSVGKAGAANQPISKVEWVDRNSIEPNDYNPNKQAPPEHRLLEISILQDGWTQPIVVFDSGDGSKPIIIDGEHRWRTSGKPSVSKLTGGMVPIVRICKPREDRIMATIRHNRARGEHGVMNMAELVKELIQSGKDAEEICTLLGMEDEELERLAEKAGLPAVVARNHGEFSKGWVPG